MLVIVSNDYVPTRHGEIFSDVGRNLEFIDTPGFEDAILDGKFDHFKADPAVKSVLNEQKIESVNILAGVNISFISAYLIVFADNDQHTKYMARALLRAIRNSQNENLRDLPIFMVSNSSDIVRSPTFQDREKEAELNQVVKDANFRASEYGDDDQKREEEKYQIELENRYGSHANLDHLRFIFNNDPINFDQQGAIPKPTKGLTRHKKVHSKTGRNVALLFNEIHTLLRGPSENRNIVRPFNRAEERRCHFNCVIF